MQLRKSDWLKGETEMSSIFRSSHTFSSFTLLCLNSLRVAACAALIIGWILLFIMDSPAMAQTEEGKPLIKFDAYEFNAGNVKEGQKILHTFDFENQGNALLKILSIESG